MSGNRPLGPIKEDEEAKSKLQRQGPLDPNAVKPEIFSKLKKDTFKNMLTPKKGTPTDEAIKSEKSENKVRDRKPSI